MDNVELLTTTEVAEIFKVTPKTIALWAKSGRICPAHKAPGIRGVLIFARTEVERVLNGRPSGAA